MLEYKCHKSIHAEPMELGAYSLYTNWDISDKDDPQTKGYLVIYNGGTEQQHISWIPKEVFEVSYTETSEALTFGEALESLKQGKKVARTGWNGKGMYLFMRVECISTDGSELEALTGIKNVVLPPIACMKTADDKVVEGWLASQTDMFSDDWKILN